MPLLIIGEQVPESHQGDLPEPQYEPMKQDDFHRFYYVDIPYVDSFGDEYGRSGYAFMQIDEFGNLIQANPFAHGLTEREEIFDYNPRTDKYELFSQALH